MNSKRLMENCFFKIGKTDCFEVNICISRNKHSVYQKDEATLVRYAVFFNESIRIFASKIINIRPGI